ncbi:MAG: single-stranded DNA-binding protein, partial [Candidatus Nephthysia bennettiae]
MNKVTLQGNLARDLDYKELGGDKCLARGLLAVSRYSKGRDGRDLIRIVLWGKQAV